VHSSPPFVLLLPALFLLLPPLNCIIHLLSFFLCLLFLSSSSSFELHSSPPLVPLVLISFFLSFFSFFFFISIAIFTIIHSSYILQSHYILWQNCCSRDSNCAFHSSPPYDPASFRQMDGKHLILHLSHPPYRLLLSGNFILHLRLLRRCL